MRDSFGGVFTINLLLVFIFIYVAFTAVSLTYAKAFRLKNKIIDFVEENEIISLEDKYLSNKLNQVDSIIENMNYNVTCDEINSQEGEETDYNGVVSYCYKGIKISLIESEKIEGTKSSIIKYEITTGATWDLGALNKILVLGGKKEESEEKITNTWLIKGEAVVIKR